MPAGSDKRNWPSSNPKDIENFAAYVADFCNEFKLMAESGRMPMLAYLLGMVHAEALRLVATAQKDSQQP